MAKINLSGVAATPSAAPPAFEYSPQQQAIMDAVDRVSSNLIIEARAGTGKTTTLLEICKRLGSGAIFLAFNKAISTEISRKLADAGLDWKSVKSSTFHAVGFQAWVKHAPRCRGNVRGEKLSLLAEKIGVPQFYTPFVKKAVSLAKQTLIGAVPEYPIDDTEVWMVLVEHHDLLDLMPQTDDEIDEQEFLDNALAWCVKLLRQSIVESPTMIDFDDMIYMPLYSNLRFWQYDWVLIDEAQDTNRARREIAKRLLRPNGRLIAVGDRHQAIYGFTGADSDALDLIQEEFDCDLLPLTVTYRCPRTVVRFAQVWVPDIEARPNAPEGVLLELDYAKFLQIIPEPGDAILCRTMKPIVKLAFGYLKRHIACHIEGREIGAGLISLARRWKSAQTLAELNDWLEKYLDNERMKLLSQHKEAKFATIEDKVTTLQVLCSSLGADQHPEAVIALITKLFKDSEGLAKQTTTLSTIHKAKGREWERVYLLGRKQLMPSPYAKQDWQLEQEDNLAYVAVTRTKSELIEVNLPPKR